MTYKIMIVEDDHDIAELLSAHLSKFGLGVYRCENFSDILSEFEKEQPHLVLLDVNLPSFDGFYWCAKLRTKTSCPIVFLSSRDSNSDQVFAISSGGDDYITKPFSFEVVTAKVNAQLRRVYGEYANTTVDELACGDCYFSQSKLLLKCGNNSAELSKTEAGIVRLMFAAFPRVISREELLSEIWDDESFVEENTLNVSISRIRKRLESIGSKLVIKSVRGLGYRIGDKSDET